MIKPGTKLTISRKIVKFGNSAVVTIPAQINPETGEIIEITIEKKAAGDE